MKWTGTDSRVSTLSWHSEKGKKHESCLKGTVSIAATADSILQAHTLIHTHTQAQTGTSMHSYMHAHTYTQKKKYGHKKVYIRICLYYWNIDVIGSVVYVNLFVKY